MANLLAHDWRYGVNIIIDLEDIVKILELYKKHLEEERQMRPRSVRDYMLVAGEMCTRFDVFNGVSYTDINSVISELKEKLEWSNGTVYKYSICTKKFWRWMQTRGYRPDNPYAFSDWKKQRPKVPEFLTEELFQKIQDDPGLDLTSLTLLWALWDTAARVNEISQLNQCDINLKDKLITIPQKIAKGNYAPDRQIPVTDRCIELLKDLISHAQRRGHTESIFLNTAINQRMTTIGIQKLITNIGMRKSPIRDMVRLTTRMFRHGKAIVWLAAGIDGLLISKWMGHSKTDQTLRYLNLDVTYNRKIFEKHILIPQNSIRIAI